MRLKLSEKRPEKRIYQFNLPTIPMDNSLAYNIVRLVDSKRAIWALRDNYCSFNIIQRNEDILFVYYAFIENGDIIIIPESARKYSYSNLMGVFYSDILCSVTIYYDNNHEFKKHKLIPHLETMEEIKKAIEEPDRYYLPLQPLQNY